MFGDAESPPCFHVETFGVAVGPGRAITSRSMDALLTSSNALRGPPKSPSEIAPWSARDPPPGQYDPGELVAVSLTG